MKKINSIDDDFQELCILVCNSYNLEPLSAKIFAILYLEEEDQSLEDLSNKTDYSLSTISKKMKLLEPLLCLKKYRKKDSKKIFFSIEKDIKKMMLSMAKKKLKDQIEPLKVGIPTIIDKYNRKNMDVKTKNKIKLLKHLKKHMSWTEKILKIMLKMSGD